MNTCCFLQIHVYNGTSKNLREEQGLNIYTDDDDNAIIIRLYIVIEPTVSK